MVNNLGNKNHEFNIKVFVETQKWHTLDAHFCDPNMLLNYGIYFSRQNKLYFQFFSRPSGRVCTFYCIVHFFITCQGEQQPMDMWKYHCRCQKLLYNKQHGTIEVSTWPNQWFTAALKHHEGGQLGLTLHYITLHCIALHYITLYCIAFALHYITLHYISLHCIALH